MTTTNTRKEEIQIAAAKLFGEKGFAASSVRDIAKSVGLGAASLYNHMGSKDELLTSICFRCANNFLEGMAIIATGWPLYGSAHCKGVAYSKSHV